MLLLGTIVAASAIVFGAMAAHLVPSWRRRTLPRQRRSGSHRQLRGRTQLHLAVWIANGLVTIMRGAVPLALFGAKVYGEVLGILATPYLLLAAIARAAFALLVERYGYCVAQATMLVAGLCLLLGMELMAVWYRRRQPR
jgi:hypothetical protein